VKRFRNVTPASGTPQTSLTAREVQEAIEERISKGVYALGQRLPPLRSIAAELGTSPSTVSRAVQEMIRNGWLDVQERQFVRVRSRLPHKSVLQSGIQSAIRSIAHKWKLWGGDERELLADITEIVSEVFRDSGQIVFTECNNADLGYLGEQISSEFPNLSIGRSLISDLDAKRLREGKAVILVPYYHYAEVKGTLGPDVSIVPVHTSPSAETLDELLTIPAGSRVLVVGHNRRSVTRLSEIVRDYVDAKITSVTEEEGEKIAKLAPQAEFVFAVWSAADAVAAAPGVKHVIVVRFALDTSLGAKLKLGSMMAAE
jgi:DNA-binding transcriptional regulator YhcF (GntR family)